LYTSFDDIAYATTKESPIVTYDKKKKTSYSIIGNKTRVFMYIYVYYIYLMCIRMQNNIYLYPSASRASSVTNRMRLVLWSLSLLIAATIQLRALHLIRRRRRSVEKKFTPAPPPHRRYIYTYIPAHTVHYFTV